MFAVIVISFLLNTRCLSTESTYIRPSNKRLISAIHEHFRTSHHNGVTDNRFGIVMKRSTPCTHEEFLCAYLPGKSDECLSINDEISCDGNDDCVGGMDENNCGDNKTPVILLEDDFENTCSCPKNITPLSGCYPESDWKIAMAMWATRGPNRDVTVDNSYGGICYIDDSTGNDDVTKRALYSTSQHQSGVINGHATINCACFYINCQFSAGVVFKISSVPVNKSKAIIPIGEIKQSTQGEWEGKEFEYASAYKHRIEFRVERETAARFHIALDELRVQSKACSDCLKVKVAECYLSSSIIVDHGKMPSGTTFNDLQGLWYNIASDEGNHLYHYKDVLYYCDTENDEKTLVFTSFWDGSSCIIWENTLIHGTGVHNALINENQFSYHVVSYISSDCMLIYICTKESDEKCLEQYSSFGVYCKTIQEPNLDLGQFWDNIADEELCGKKIKFTAHQSRGAAVPNMCIEELKNHVKDVPQCANTKPIQEKRKLNYLGASADSKAAAEGPSSAAQSMSSASLNHNQAQQQPKQTKQSRNIFNNVKAEKHLPWFSW